MRHKRGDVVITLFPFADGPVAKRRPAVIIAGPWQIRETIAVCWIAMVTTSVLKGWPGDMDIVDLKAAGLPIPSIIRSLKIACIDVGIIDKKAGHLDARALKSLMTEIEKHLVE